MKTFTKVLVSFILIFGLVTVLCNIFDVTNAVGWNATLIAFGFTIIVLAFIVRKDHNVQFFTSLTDSMFESDIYISAFLDDFYYQSLKLGRNLIIVGVIALIAPGFKLIYVVEALIFIFTIFKYVELFYKLSIKYTK